MPPPLVFTADELERAHDTWGCNGGPSALAAIWKLPLLDVRSACMSFMAKGYMNPTDMRAAIDRVGARIDLDNSDETPDAIEYPKHGLCLIQFSGPWITDKGQNFGWAAKHTHWIASKKNDEGHWIFDCNMLSWQSLAYWDREVLPALVCSDTMRSGDFWLKHSWEIRAKRK